MGKILYIRLDSSPLPEACDEITVKDFNLESYFCALLGRRLLEEQAVNQSIPFPGKIISDFKDFSPEIYGAIIAQWENMLIQLLTADDIQGLRFKISLPFTYLDWLAHHENPIYREIGKIQSPTLDFKSENLYEELISCVLMKRLHFTLSRITDDIDYIVVSLPIQKTHSPFISYIKQLNDKFNDLEVADRQMFMDTYVASKRIVEKKMTLETMYELSSPHEGRIRIRDKKTKKYGFINEQMDWVVPCEYDFCGYFVDGLAFVYDKNKGAYQIDRSGNVHDLPSYDYYEVHDFSDGLARVRKDKEGNYAYINKEGKEIINVHCGCGEFKEGYAIIVNDDGEYGFIDKTGTEVIPCQFDYASDFSEGLARVEINDMNGFVDKTGKMVIPCKYKSADDFSEGLATVYINDKSGFIDKSGKVVIPCRFYIAWGFSEGLAAVSKSEGDSKTYFIDQSGNTIFSISGLSYKFSNGLAATDNGRKIGYIDKTGKVVIPNIFERHSGSDLYNSNLFDFSDGLALVSKKSYGSLYFINKKGEIIVPPNKYRDMKPFHDGLAYVDGGFIDNKGNEIIPPGIFYNQDCYFSEGMLWIKIFVNGVMRYALIKKEWIM